MSTELEAMFNLEHPSAVRPKKHHKNDVGYDITAIGVFKQLSSRSFLFETGVSVKPPEGYYFELVPRSSMSKSGYMQTNGVGIIDPEYTGTIKIPMIKVDDNVPDMTFPFVTCQLILRQFNNYSMYEGDFDKDTTRGSGGFGSTDAK